MAQLHPQALGSLFFAFYGSQDYDGGIVTRLHAWNIENVEIIQVLLKVMLSVDMNILQKINYCRNLCSLHFRYWRGKSKGNHSDSEIIIWNLK
jgi:hypothetical protein